MGRRFLQSAAARTGFRGRGDRVILAGLPEFAAWTAESGGGSALSPPGRRGRPALGSRPFSYISAIPAAARRSPKKGPSDPSLT